MTLPFDNSYANQLDGLFVPHQPRGFPDPSLLFLDEALATELGLDPQELRRHGANWFSGTIVPTGAAPIAQAYAGHQFGGFSPQLGDGRALLLGEVLDPAGRRWDVALKGSGPTAFSRGGDGRATLSSVLREYVMSQAMHHLGVPTTRSLAVVTTGEKVMRTQPNQGAVLCRVASSHLRVGTFEFFAARRDHAKLERLVRYSVARHAPDAEGPPALALLRHVAIAQATLIAAWMQIGFIHGVMNTDNCAVSGETIDYGPCAFMDTFAHDTVFSSIDHNGRYAYGNQPTIGQWNLARLAESVLPLLDADEATAIEHAQAALELFVETYNDVWLTGMRAKLGLYTARPDDRELITDLLALLEQQEHDYTGTLRALSRLEPDPGALPGWSERWSARLADEPPVADRAARMDAVNPVVIPRNHLVQGALDAADQDDLAPLQRLLEALSAPFTADPRFADLAGAAPEDFGPYQTFCGT